MKYYLVGGAVRDELLELPTTEKDWLVVGATPEEMINLKYKQVGKHFPVFLHPKTGEEYALARLEKKDGKGYHGFAFNSDAKITIEQDLIRRDFTINSIAKNVETGELIDPCGGIQDLKNKIIRHNSSAFVEDPLRLIRLARFYAKLKPLGFTICDETIEKIQEIVAIDEVKTISVERMWGEFEKAFKSEQPHAFLEVLCLSGFADTLRLGKLFSSECVQALAYAEQQTDDEMVKFGSWCAFADINDLTKLSNWLPVPNRYIDLIGKVNQHFNDYYESCEKSIDKILKFLYKISAFKQGNVFDMFILSCEYASKSREKYRQIPHPQTRFIQSMRHQAKLINADSIMRVGLSGEQLAKEIDKQRCAVMSKITRPYRWSFF